MQADINQFYPSLYTHAIPWAIHSKAFAKANRGNQHLGNLLDTKVRNGQDAQTMGIPIGPDSSFLIAEALLGSLDVSIQGALGNAPGLRMLDEYEFAFDSYTAAEEAIATLQNQLAEYELALNPMKTRILECPIPIDPAWLTDLKSIQMPESGQVSKRTLSAFIDKAFALATENRDGSVLNWVVSRMMSLTFTSDQWRLVEPLVLQAAASEPGSLSRCLRLLLFAKKASHSIDLTQLHSSITKLTRSAVRRGHGSEASWGVWGHILFNLPLDAELLADITGVDDDVVALVTLDAQRRGLVPTTEMFSQWQSTVSSNAWEDGHWLLAYETAAKNWFPGTAKPITSNLAFADMLSRGVSFFQCADAETLTLAHSHSAPAWLSPAQTYLLSQADSEFTSIPREGA